MEEQTKLKWKVIILFILSILIVTDCAHLFKKPKSEESLRALVQKEWEAKVKGDWGTVYDLASKEFKNKIERDKFLQGAKLRVENFSLKEVKIDSRQGKAWVNVSYDINQMGMSLKGATTKEEWIWEDGEWRHKLKPVSTPFD